MSEIKDINMENEEFMSDDSQMRLEAMLYLFEDPSLDRIAFEARLENDFQLAEILAESVGTFQSMKSIASLSPIADQPMPQVVLPSNRSTWNVLTAIAATVGFVGFLGWMVFETSRIEPVEIASSLQNTITEKSIASAWSELQTESEPVFVPSRDFLDDSVDSEGGLAVVADDPFSIKDVPEWLVMATEVNLEDSIDSKDSKVLLQ